EARPFRPHVTLGRARKEARPRDLAGLESALAKLEFAQTAVASTLDLMQSTLRSGGAVYNVRHSERLPSGTAPARALRRCSRGGARGMVVPLGASAERLPPARA